MERFVCIHGHFYQPPRENAWLEEVELQESAHPYHDWNHRIAAESYSANAFARILGPDGTISGIINNYEWMSFNFGPTLLSWMERHRSETYQAILQADALSTAHFGGHGSAIAQGYNHIIMPLADRRDKQTQVEWGIRDFENRFGRDPEGMWLPETAADIETLEILAANGVGFTILSPYQAAEIMGPTDTEWSDVTGGRVDPRRPYRCTLPSGRSIAIFFYDGPVSQDIAFGGLLNNGEHLAGRLLELVPEDDETHAAPLAHIATDGETYGHHHRNGEMALAYCLHYLRRTNAARVTIYGEYLELNPPTFEAHIVEQSSWSCSHGVERWRADCGCNSGMHPGWQQKWREPLREALDWLRDRLRDVYEDAASQWFTDPWDARDRYIEFIWDRSIHSLRRFLAAESPGILQGEINAVISLLEMQRNAQLMYTSCGWFFDEISGIETVQILQYAARALQLCRKGSGEDFTDGFLEILETAPSNHPEFRTGADVYRSFVAHSPVEPERIAAHYAVTRLFEVDDAGLLLAAFDISPVEVTEESAGRGRFICGTVAVRSRVTTEEQRIAFAVLHLGDHNLFGGAMSAEKLHSWNRVQSTFRRHFLNHATPRLIVGLDDLFGESTDLLQHLFRDEQKRVVAKLLEAPRLNLEASHRRLMHENYAMLQSVARMEVSLPRELEAPVRHILNIDLQRVFEKERLDLQTLDECLEEFRRWNILPRGDEFGLMLIRTIQELLGAIALNPSEEEIIDHLLVTFDLIDEFRLDIDLSEVQNTYFTLCRSIYAEAVLADDEWARSFAYIGRHLNIDADTVSGPLYQPS